MNRAVGNVLAARLSMKVHVPEDPQMVAAIGCALAASEAECH